jgi:mRNA interferase MazF
LEYVPDIGHVVWIDLDPKASREQRGQRPALVLSAASYNAKT